MARPSALSSAGSETSERARKVGQLLAPCLANGPVCDRCERFPVQGASVPSSAPKDPEKGLINGLGPDVAAVRELQEEQRQERSVLLMVGMRQLAENAAPADLPGRTPCAAWPELCAPRRRRGGPSSRGSAAARL